jgi:urease accessory protein
MAANPTDITAIEQQGWRAELQLGFARQGDRTVLARRQHIGPLVVQRPFYPEGDICHVYLVHPPGGIVGGDQLRFAATLEPDSQAVITTPAATKFYRSAPDRRAQLQQSLLLRDATLEWLPQEAILFRDAHVSTATVVNMNRKSRFIGWELTCYGRPASNERFDSGTARQDFELWIDERPVMLDHLRIDGGMAMQAPWGLAANSTLGTLLAYPATADDLDAAREHNGFACTLVDNVLSCRMVSADSDLLKKSFVSLWQTLRPRIVGREAVLPRIWAT